MKTKPDLYDKIADTYATQFLDARSDAQKNAITDAIGIKDIVSCNDNDYIIKELSNKSFEDLKRIIRLSLRLKNGEIKDEFQEQLKEIIAESLGIPYKKTEIQYDIYKTIAETYRLSNLEQRKTFANNIGLNKFYDQKHENTILNNLTTLNKNQLEDLIAYLTKLQEGKINSLTIEKINTLITEIIQSLVIEEAKTYEECKFDPTLLSANIFLNTTSLDIKSKIIIEFGLHTKLNENNFVNVLNGLSNEFPIYLAQIFTAALKTKNNDLDFDTKNQIDIALDNLFEDYNSRDYSL